MFFFFPTDIPPSVPPSIHPCISKVLGAFIIVVLMHAPRLQGYFQPLFPLLCTLSPPLLLYFGGDLYTAAFCKGQLRAGLAVFSPMPTLLLLMLAVPTRGSEAAQCEPWRGHKNRLRPKCNFSFKRHAWNPFMSNIFVVVVEEEVHFCFLFFIFV